MTDETDPAAEVARYRVEMLAEIERLTAHNRIITSILEWNDAFREETLQALTQFDLATMPTSDAPPIAVTLMRAELARTLIHLRRAGRIAKKIGVPMRDLEVSMRHLKLAVEGLPIDLKKSTRRLP